MTPQSKVSTPTPATVSTPPSATIATPPPATVSTPPSSTISTAPLAMAATPPSSKISTPPSSASARDAAVSGHNRRIDILLRHRWGRLLVPSLADLLFVALIAWLFLSNGVHGWQSLLTDADVGWHIRTG